MPDKQEDYWLVDTPSFAPDDGHIERGFLEQLILPSQLLGPLTMSKGWPSQAFYG